MAIVCFFAAEEHKTVEVLTSGQAHMVVFLPESINLIVTDGWGMVALVIGNSRYN
jgi:hypothetical protein